MGKLKKKPVIGILGGIGSGKSTAAQEFGRLGCKVIDADAIAHQVLERKGVKAKATELFGRGVIGRDGGINHRKLADIVFADGDKLAALNNIVHPMVLAKIEKLMGRYQGQKRVKAIVLDIPLLVEVGWAKCCDRLVFIDCKRALRLKRANKTGGWNEENIKIREKFQISLDNKAGLSDNIIDNNSGLSKLVRQVAEIFSSVVGK